MALRIDKIWAFVATDKEGNEGICASYFPESDMWLPLIGADMERIEIVRPLAELVAQNSNSVVKLVYFHNRTVIEENIK